MAALNRCQRMAGLVLSMYILPCPRIKIDIRRCELDCHCPRCKICHRANFAWLDMIYTRVYKGRAWHAVSQLHANISKPESKPITCVAAWRACAWRVLAAPGPTDRPELDYSRYIDNIDIGISMLSGLRTIVHIVGRMHD